MSKDTIDKLAGLGSLTEEHLASVEEVGRVDLTLTALAVAIHVLDKVPPEREGGDLKAMKLLFHELAGDDADIWGERAEYLVDGD
jgi:hypothetical protein